MVDDLLVESGDSRPAIFTVLLVLPQFLQACTDHFPIPGHRILRRIFVLCCLILIKLSTLQNGRSSASEKLRCSCVQCWIFRITPFVFLLFIRSWGEMRMPYWRKRNSWLLGTTFWLPDSCIRIQLWSQWNCISMHRHEIELLLYPPQFYPQKGYHS